MGKKKNKQQQPNELATKLAQAEEREHVVRVKNCQLRQASLDSMLAMYEQLHVNDKISAAAIWIIFWFTLFLYYQSISGEWWSATNCVVLISVMVLFWTLKENAARIRKIVIGWQERCKALGQN